MLVFPTLERGQILLICYAQARFESTNVVVGILTLPALAMFFCGASCVTSNSRQAWSAGLFVIPPCCLPWSHLSLALRPQAHLHSACLNQQGTPELCICGISFARDGRLFRLALPGVMLTGPLFERDSKGLSLSKRFQVQRRKDSGSHGLAPCRMLWSFSRDGGIPFHRVWSAINKTSGTPILAVWAMVIFAFLLGLPMLHSTAAFQAVTSISTIGLYLSCESVCPSHEPFEPSKLLQGMCLSVSCLACSIVTERGSRASEQTG